MESFCTEPNPNRMLSPSTCAGGRQHDQRKRRGSTRCWRGSHNSSDARRFFYPHAVHIVVSLLLLSLAGPPGVGAQTICTESSVAVVGVSNDPATLAQECTILLGLKDTLRGTATLNWAEDLVMTSWDGVTTHSSGHVTSLSLLYKNLDGSIPADLNGLTFLSSLSLHRNKLSGKIPEELGDLSRLRVLTLNHNSLNGPIPAALGKLNCLQNLALNDNELSGLPEEWEQSEERTGGGCSLGTNPAIVSFADLNSMIISNNKLSGSIYKGDCEDLSKPLDAIPRQQ